ncbi:MAG: DNA polymerase [Olpidium bornovanus]|uniref:DNA polymerase n=1 Tax=Olpidium bornovanus TaxID=278681 RepID=A0A8H7ZRN0_9FUNG|nr:MAG: DNA polymerase [Olpidium bornovanus]
MSLLSVVVRGAAKSMMAAKSLRPPVMNVQQAEHWVGILSSELFTRLRDEFDDNQRWPKTLVLQFTPTDGGRDRSRSGPFPPRHDVTSPEAIAQRAMRLLLGQQYVSGNPTAARQGQGHEPGLANALPCSRFALSATGLEKVEGWKSKAIEQYFAKGAAQASPVGHPAKEDGPSSTRQQAAQNAPRTPKGIAAFFQPKPTLATTSPSATVSARGPGKAVQPKDERQPPPPEGTTQAASISTSSEKPFALSGGDDEGPDNTGDGKNGEWTCEKCGQKFRQEQMAEHKDYHFALDLDRSKRSGTASGSAVSPRPPKRPNGPSAAGKTGGKRRASGGRSAPSRPSQDIKRRMEDLFSKRT